MGRHLRLSAFESSPTVRESYHEIDGDCKSTNLSNVPLLRISVLRRQPTLQACNDFIRDKIASS